MKLYNYILKLWNDHPYRIILAIVSLALAIMIGFYLNGPNTAEDDLGGPAQFGQFGDYIGGLLNPVFGFLTVLLLIGTSMHSRRELDVSRQEYNRKQLEDAIRKACDNHLYILNTPVRHGFTFSISEVQSKSIKEYMENHAAFSIHLMQALALNWRNGQKPHDEHFLFEKLDSNVKRLTQLVSDLLKLTHVDSLKSFWIAEAKDRIDDCWLIGVLTDEEVSALIGTLD